MRKRLAITLFFLGFLGSIYAQDIQVVKEKLNKLEGNFYIREAITQATTYLNEGAFEDAATVAAMAYEEAQKKKSDRLMALALHLQARATVDNPDASKRDIKDAEKLLEESLDLVENSKYQELRLSNLKLLKQLAQMRGKRRKERKIDEEISELGLQSVDRIAENVSPENDLTIDPIMELDNPQVIPSLENSEKEKLKLKEKIDKLVNENENLGAILSKQEEQIDTLSKIQLQAELKLANQRILLNSMEFQSRFDSIDIAQKELQIQEKNAQLSLQRSQRNFFLALALIVLIIGLGLLSRYISIKHYNKILEEKNIIIQEEKKRSEDLLLNILPSAIAEELKNKGVAEAREYTTVTVLFADFKDFSRKIDSFSPEQLVKELDYCFSEFDRIIDKYRLEKIKTIGDAYMCAGGVPDPDPDHPRRMIQAALEMQSFLSNRKVELSTINAPYFEARIGIHSGPIIAGVVGRKKFAYDIWGDTVNVASRVESKGTPGKVNISGVTQQLIGDEFEFDYRGKIPAKNVGEIDMYYVS